MKIFIGGAWPYANNSLHVGHLAALLPGDILARYYRQRGDQVIYVSGTDTHGTPITERAKKEGISPDEIARNYHNEFKKCFEDLDFSYDIYTHTETEYHKSKVQEILKRINEFDFLSEKFEEQDYCSTCNKFLADREIGGFCPICGEFAKGDQCDSCLTSFDAKDLAERKCISCGNSTVEMPNKEIVFKLSHFQDKIQNYFDGTKKLWRFNAINETKKYLDAGLRDRDVTRNINWGIEIPFKGYENKRVYVWFDAVLGYLTACQFILEQRDQDYVEFMRDSDDLRTYYVHGKDNIPFHTIILPALIMAQTTDVQLPKYIISSEYINMGLDKMSKSKGNVILIKDLIRDYSSDTIRFYFILNNPEKKDVTFNLDEMIALHNKVLVGGFGNFINRNLSFIKSNFDGVVPNGIVKKEVIEKTMILYETVSNYIENGDLRFALEELVRYIQYANKYYDDCQPWIQAKQDDKSDFNNTTATCVFIMANLSNLLYPFIPKGCEMLKKILKIKDYSWETIYINQSIHLDECPLLYTRLK